MIVFICCTLLKEVIYPPYPPTPPFFLFYHLKKKNFSYPPIRFTYQKYRSTFLSKRMIIYRLLDKYQYKMAHFFVILSDQKIIYILVIQVPVNRQIKFIKDPLMPLFR